MRKGFYTKLAASNIKKNSRTYIPYIITCIITAAMFYIINSLSNNESIKKLYGGETILITLGYGTYVTAIFAFIFLFYTNSFLMKRRKKEFGVLNILGMEKRHISKVLLLENIYIAFITMLLGIIIGMVLDKAMFLILTKMLGAEHSPGFYISKEALIHTVILFGIIFFCIYLNSLRQIHLSKPIELLNGGNVGEKEPKTKMNMSDLDKINTVFMISLDDYNSINSENETLNENEVLIYSRRNEYEYSTIQLFDTKYNVKKNIKQAINNGRFFSNNLTESIQIVVKDRSVLDKINNYLNENFKEDPKEEQDLKEEPAFKYLYGFDINGSEDSKKSLYNDIKKLLKESNFIGDSECGQIQREGIKGLYGGMFFLGIFLGSIFTMATILIIYYKQISEGYEDKERFRIMQNVGMSHAEVKRSIHSQIMTVFFMPLIMAGIHVAFAFPIVKQILMMLNLTNTRLYIICTIVCFVAFTIIYAVIYSLTAKIYYHIVSTRD